MATDQQSEIPYKPVVNPDGTDMGGYPPPTAHVGVAAAYPPPQSTSQQGGVLYPPLSGQTSAPPPAYQPGSDVPPVIQQPTKATNQVIHTQSGPTPQSFLVLSMVACLLCFFCGNWLTFICLIPAMVFSFVSESRASAGDYVGARSMGMAALACNVASFVFYLITLVIVAIAVGVTIAQRNKECTVTSYYYDPIAGRIRSRCL